MSADDLFDEINEGHIESNAATTDVLVTAAFDEPSSYVIEAIRLLGMLLEEGLADYDSAKACLVALLKHDDELRRCFAVSAIWQSGDSAFLPALREALEEAVGDYMKVTTTRAIRALEYRSSNIGEYGED